MNALIAFTDVGQVCKLLEWTAEMGGVKEHQLILMPFKNLDASPAVEIGKRAFKSVRVEPDHEGVTSNWSAVKVGEKAAAQGPNSMARQAAWFFYLQKLGPWMFWEPDAVPLVPDWLDRLEAEYKQAGRPFMGAFVGKSSTGTPAHLTGNAIYPQNAIELAPTLSVSGSTAFDVAAAGEILPKAHYTKLIQHVFYHPNYPEQPTFPDQESLKLIRDDAVIFHRNKDLTLIDRLRERCGVAYNPHYDERELDKFKAEGAKAWADVPDGSKWVRELRGEESEIPRVHCYFRPGHGEFLEEQKRLLAIWEREWKQAGFEPVVLTEDDAAKHPRSAEWKAEFEKIPSVNPPGFEMASWTRWIAMAVVGGGLMTDYDVIPRAGFMEAFESHISEKEWSEHKFPQLFCNCVPCAVHGSKTQYESAADAFIICRPGIEQGKPHLSDMHACKQMGFWALDICKEYFASGWKTSPLIHFPHRRCNPQSRSQVIEQALKELRTEPVGRLHGTEEPETMASKRRYAVSLLKPLSDTPSRKILTVAELRKQGVIFGSKKKRKKRKFAV